MSCKAAVGNRIINVAVGLPLVHVLRGVLLCFARFCGPVFVKRIANAAAGLLLVTIGFLKLGGLFSF